MKRDCSFPDFRETASEMDLVQQIERALEQPGKTRTGLAKHMGWHPNRVTNILNGSRRVQLEELPKIKDYLGLDAVRIVGSVRAGDEAHYYGEGSDDPNEAAPMIPEAGADTVAVEIRGTSLGAALEGWLAYYDDRRAPVTPDLLGRLCVVGLDDGRVLIKIPRQARGRGRYHLFPNAGGDIIMDAKVEWAARVIDLKPKS